MTAREDLGRKGNTARRKFWEMCASRQPRMITAPDGDCLWSEEVEAVAEWADEMLTEWDKRWIEKETDWTDENVPGVGMDASQMGFRRGVKRSAEAARAWAESIMDCNVHPTPHPDAVVALRSFARVLESDLAEESGGSPESAEMAR